MCMVLITREMSSTREGIDEGKPWTPHTNVPKYAEHTRGEQRAAGRLAPRPSSGGGGGGVCGQGGRLGVEGGVALREEGHGEARGGELGCVILNWIELLGWKESGGGG